MRARGYAIEMPITHCLNGRRGDGELGRDSEDGSNAELFRPGEIYGLHLRELPFEKWNRTVVTGPRHDLELTYF